MLAHLADLLGPSEASSQLTVRFHTPVDGTGEDAKPKHTAPHLVSTNQLSGP